MFFWRRFLMPCAVLTALCVQTAAGATVGDLVNQVSQTQYRHFLDDMLYTRTGDNRGMTGPQHDPCRDNIFNYFQSLGLQTSLDPHPSTANWPACTNVVAVKLGTVRPNDIYIISAHYDSVNNPGADDNASAVAAVMEIARVLAPYQFEATIRFIAWDAEEVYPRVGSKRYAGEHFSENLLGVISVEMISYNNGSNKVYLGADYHRVIQDRLATTIQLYGQGLTTVITSQLVDTDNWSFVYWGIENTYITEEWPNPNYHKLTDSVDTPGYIDYAYATKMTRSLVGYLASETMLVDRPDTTPPQTIADLAAATGGTSGTINLTWTAPTDYGTDGSGPFAATNYDLRYRTSPITNANWANATKIVGLPTPRTPGLAGSFTVSGLTNGTTYYFAIKSKDSSGNTSALSNLATATPATPDLTPPDWVGDLLARPTAVPGQIALTWTAPADHGPAGSGPSPCTSYSLRYSTTPIRYDDNNASWNAATSVTGLPAPKAPALAQSFTVTGLPGGTLYFAIKAADAANNTSLVSNSAPVRVPLIGEKTLQVGLAGYTGQIDTYIVGNSPANHTAQEGLVVAGHANQGTDSIQRGLLRFDLGAIPTGTRITSATLSLFSYDMIPAAGGSGTYGVYPLDMTWSDSQAHWTLASTGITWTTPGGDFPAQPDATAPQQPQTGTWYNWDVTARVQSWLDGSPANFGWLLKLTDETALIQETFYQSEGSTPTLRPKLVISDLAPPITGDIDGDGVVDVIDLLILTETWDKNLGQRAYDPRCDFNTDGTIDIVDLLTFSADWPK